MPETTTTATGPGAQTVETISQEATDSAEVSINAKGEVSIKVKCYGIDPGTVVRESHRATLDLTALFNLSIKSLNPDQGV